MRTFTEHAGALGVTGPLKIVGAALNADLWDFCGARQGYRRLTQSAVQRLWPGFQGRVRGSARVAGSRYPD